MNDSRYSSGLAFGGRRVSVGAATLVDLCGTWSEMGRQYGALLKDELLEVCAFTGRIISASAENAERAAAMLKMLTGQMPWNIRQFLCSAAEASGLTLDQMYAAYGVEYIAGLPLCSAVVAYDEYAAGPLVFGRNYDYGEAFLELCRDVVITVFHPADGSLAVATVGYAGEVYAVNALNEKGLFIELNNGTPSTHIERNDSRICSTTLLLDLMFEADTLDHLDKFFETALANDSFIINAADEREARSYEWCPVGVRRGEGFSPKGLIVSTNHYVNTEWGFETPGDDTSWQSITRRKNLMSLAEKYKGCIDADCMCRILDRRLEDGGATDDLTVYQLVVIPETMEMHIKVAGNGGWAKVCMKDYLII